MSTLVSIRVRVIRIRVRVRVRVQPLIGCTALRELDLSDNHVSI